MKRKFIQQLLTTVGRPDREKLIGTSLQFLVMNVRGRSLKSLFLNIWSNWADFDPLDINFFVVPLVFCSYSVLTFRGSDGCRQRMDKESECGIWNESVLCPAGQNWFNCYLLCLKHFRENDVGRSFCLHILHIPLTNDEMLPLYWLVLSEDKEASFCSVVDFPASCHIKAVRSSFAFRLFTSTEMEVHPHEHEHVSRG
jgi:hypothetical protein